jgi:hypothetical protein
VDPQRIAEILLDLANTSDGDLRDALAACRTQGQELATNSPSADNVEALATLVGHSKQLAAELTRRTDATDLAARQQEALAELDGTHDPARDHIEHPEPETTQDVPDPAEHGDVPGEPAADAAAGDTAEKGKTGKAAKDKATDGELATRPRTRAAAGLGNLNGNHPPTANTAGTVVAQTRVRGGVPGMEFGTPLTDESFIQAFAEKASATGGDGRMDVARMQFTYPPERFLGDNSTENTARIAKAKGPEALTAAGGLCLPLEVRYDIKVLGVTDRPVRDALTRFGVNRGGIQYRAPFDALAMTSGLGVWTQAMDQAIVTPPADPDTNVYKSCMVVNCPGVVEASIYSTYQCLEFPNMTARFDTEWVNATTRAAAVAWARFSDNQLLSRLFSGSKLLKGLGGKLSAIADLLATYDRVISYYRSRHRLNSTVPLRTIMPQWVIDMLRTDLARRMTMGSPAELFGIAQGTIESFFNTRNVNVTWHLDGLDGATVNGVTIPNQYYGDTTAGQGVPDWPTSVDSLLYVEGDWLWLDGGTLDLGLVRDSNLNRRNRYQTFFESFEGVAFDGKESLRIVLPLEPIGSAVGTKAPADWDTIA